MTDQIICMSVCIHLSFKVCMLHIFCLIYLISCAAKTELTKLKKEMGLICKPEFTD